MNIQPDEKDSDASSVIPLISASSEENDHNALHEDLASLEEGTEKLLGEGAITPKQAVQARDAIDKVRKSFRDLTPQQKKKLINQRVGYGQMMMQSTLVGATAAVHSLKLEHGILKNLFAQFVPFFDRALVNMNIFGVEHFGKANNADRMKALTQAAIEFYDATKKARIEAQDVVDAYIASMTEMDEDFITPTVPIPSLETEIHIHSMPSMKHMQGYIELDKLVGLCAFMEWNGLRTEKEISLVMRPLMQMATACGRRGYLTFTELMRKRAEKAKEPEVPASLAA